MRKRALTAAFLLLLPSPALAAQPSAEDKLFDQLKKADSAQAAKPIESKLNDLFHASGSASVDLLMTRAGAALGQSDHGTARKLVDAVTRFAPGYAEGWRLRAHMQRASGDDAGAMVSLDKAVRANPRHFTAMAELAGMMEDYGDRAGALKLYRRALALDPHLAAAVERAKALTKEIEGQGI